MLSEGTCRDYIRRQEDFSKRERKVYADLVEAHRTRHCREEFWTRALSEMVAYNEPHFASVTNIKQVPVEDLFVTANFVGLGKQDYMVQHKDKFYFHQTVAGYRREPIQFDQVVF